MAEIKVKALDSAAAMEEVVKRLGVDALIVSTRKIDGQIEIVATNDDPNPAWVYIPNFRILEMGWRIFTTARNAIL